MAAHLLLFSIIFVVMFVVMGFKALTAKTTQPSVTAATRPSFISEFKALVLASALISVVIMALMYLVSWMLPEKKPASTSPLTQTYQSPEPSRRSSTVLNEDGSKTVHFDNFKSHGDAGLNVRCFQDGGKAKCVSVP